MARRPGDGPRSRRAVSPNDQGKIERWHQTLKNRILLENYYMPGDLKAEIEAFVLTTITFATTRASATLRPPTSTSGAARQSSCKEKRSNDRQSKTAACCVIGKPHNINHQMSKSLP